MATRVEGGDQRRDGCPEARHFFQGEVLDISTRKFGCRLIVDGSVDILFCLELRCEVFLLGNHS